MVSGQRHETTQRRSATAIHIPVALCDAPGVKTKILSTKKGPGCKHRSRSHGESGEVFLLDTLSHRMCEMSRFGHQSYFFRSSKASLDTSAFSRQYATLASCH